jgi:hypothetical protein
MRDVMLTDMERGYLRTFKMKGREWHGDCGLEFGRFLYVWG